MRQVGTWVHVPAGGHQTRIWLHHRDANVWRSLWGTCGLKVFWILGQHFSTPEALVWNTPIGQKESQNRFFTTVLDSAMFQIARKGSNTSRVCFTFSSDYRIHHLKIKVMKVRWIVSDNGHQRQEGGDNGLAFILQRRIRRFERFEGNSGMI